MIAEMERASQTVRRVNECRYNPPARHRICPRCRKPIIRPHDRVSNADAMNMGAGFVQTKNGGISVKNGGIVVAAAADPCCCSTFSCATAGDIVSLPSSVAIVGYFDGFFTLPGPTPINCGATPNQFPSYIWDGTFEVFGSSPWAPSAGLFTMPSSPLSRFGFLKWYVLGGIQYWTLAQASIYYCNSNVGSPPTAKFSLSITAAGASTEIWTGRLDSGGDGTGTYTQTSGCATGVTTLTVA